MTDTAIIDEVRKIRRRIAEECGNDLAKIAQRASEAAKRFKAETASRNARPNVKMAPAAPLRW